MTDCCQSDGDSAHPAGAPDEGTAPRGCQSEGADRAAVWATASLFAGSPDAVLVYDADGRVVAHSDRLAKLLGYGEGEVAKLTWPGDFVAAKGPQSDGAAAPAWVACDLRHRGGQVVRVGVCTEALFVRGEALYRATVRQGLSTVAGLPAPGDYCGLFANNHAVMLLIDPTNGEIVDANPAAVAFYGHGRDGLAGKRLGDLGTEPPEALLGAIEEAEAGPPGTWVTRHQLADGSLRDVEVHSGPVTLWGRRLLFMIVHDIGERRRAEEALALSELKYRIVAENTYDWEYWQSPDGALAYCSPSCARMTGYEAAEFIEDSSLLERIVYADDLPRFRAHRREERASGLAGVEFRITARDGTVRWIEHVCQPVHGPSGESLGTRVNNRDATGRKLAEQERSLLLAELAASGQRAEEVAAYLQRERDILHAIMENTSTQLAYLDRRFNFVNVNTAYVEGSGYSRDVLIGRNHFELFPNEENEAIFAHVRDTCRPVRFHEKPFEYVDQPERGVTYWDWTLVPVGEPGDVRGLVLSLTDVTDRVKARRRIEELAAEAQQRAGTLAATIASMADGVVVYGPTGEIVSLNPVADSLLGYTPEMKGLPIVERIEALRPAAEDGAAYRVTSFPALRALRGEMVLGDTLNVSLRGSRRWLAVSAAPVRDAEGVVTGAVAVLRDVTEARASRERLEQRNEVLRQQQERLAALTEELDGEKARLTAIIANAPHAILVTDANARVLLTNVAADRLYGGRQLLGVRLPEVASMSFSTAAGEPLSPADLPLARSALEGVTLHGVSITVTLPGGERRHTVTSSAPILDRDDRPIGAVAIVEDVTERWEAERERDRLLVVVERTALELQDANERLQSQAAELRAQKDELIELTRDMRSERERLMVTLLSIGDGVVSADARGTVRLMNPVAEAMTGWAQADAIGRPVREVVVMESEAAAGVPDDPVRYALESGQPLQPAEHSLLTARGGERRTVAYTATPMRDSGGEVVGAVLAFQDATERRRLREEIARADKLEALGVMARGVAHDFNNLLTAILGNVILAKLEAGENREVREALGEAERAAARARDLTQQLLVFAHGGAPVRKPVQLADAIADTARLALRGSALRCELTICDELWPVHVDEGDIREAIQDLVANAREAMPGDGTVSVSAENVLLDGEEDLPLPAGPYLRLRVADQGVGIPREHLDRVFDPYFTARRKGGGMGLASCYSAVRRHGGHIVVESEEGSGSTFTVYLPAAHSVPQPEPPVDGEVVRGHGRVLVMDDEAVVRSVLQRMLTRLGYEVEVSIDGGEALAAYRRAREEGRAFDAVIMDLTVPGGMGGLQAIELLKQYDPDVRAIVSSGYSNDPVMAQYRQHGFMGVMTKPYRIEELSAALRRALGG